MTTTHKIHANIVRCVGEGAWEDQTLVIDDPDHGILARVQGGENQGTLTGACIEAETVVTSPISYRSLPTTVLPPSYVSDIRDAHDQPMAVTGSAIIRVHYDDEAGGAAVVGDIYRDEIINARPGGV